MKINSNILLDALKTVRPAISAKPVMPILANFKIDGDKVIATNLNITIIAHVDELATEPITLPYAEVLSICSSVKGELDVTPELIKTGKSSFKLGEPYDVDTFPKLEPVKGMETTIPESLIVSLKKAAQVTNKQDGFQVTEHVHLHRKNDVLTVNSTDKFLAFHEAFPAPGADFSAVVPVAIINAIEPDEYTLTLSENAIQFSNEFVTVSGKLGEGSYPNMAMFFRLEDKPHSVNLNKADLIDALNEVTVYSILPSCSFVFGSDSVTLSIKDDAVKKDATTTISATCSADVPAITLNAVSLKKLISFLPEKQDEVTLHLTSDTKPVQINAATKDMQLILMPLMQA